MTKTTNYQLPKWEKTDRVQMKDFNDMTATLDEVLHGLAVSAEAAQAAVDSEAAARAAAITALENKSRFTKLKEVNVSGSTDVTRPSSYTLNVGDIPWAQYDKVHIDLCYAASGSLCLNGSSTTFLSLEGCPVNTWAYRITFEVGSNAARKVSAMQAGATGKADITYQGLSSLLWKNTFFSTSRIVVWGEK